MPPAFRQMVEGICAAFEWPKNKLFGNAFKYMWEQFADNVKTNLNTHCESRLKKFFRMRAYELNDMIRRGMLIDQPWFDSSDVSNAVKFAYHRKFHAQTDESIQKMAFLLEQLYAVGAPDMPDDQFNIRGYTANNWFQSLRMWINIQRDIHHFHLAFADIRQSWAYHRAAPRNVTRPTIPEPPKIANFAAIPMCTFQRRHVRIDTDVLYNILCAVKEVPRKLGMPTKKGKVKMRNITQNDFRLNEAGSWDLFFDRAKIDRQVKSKKPFPYQILSDGVSATLLYSKPQEPECTITNEEIVNRLEDGQLSYEIGIDPGMRTWNAAVRRNLLTGEEVSYFDKM